MNNRIAIEDQVAFEDTRDGALALRLYEVVCDQYGGDPPQAPMEDVLHTCVWLLIEALAGDPPEQRERILARLGDEVLRRLDELEAPPN
jgi:hypothetical protein